MFRKYILRAWSDSQKSPSWSIVARAKVNDLYLKKLVTLPQHWNLINNLHGIRGEQVIHSYFHNKLCVEPLSKLEVICSVLKFWSNDKKLKNLNFRKSLINLASLPLILLLTSGTILKFISVHIKMFMASSFSNKRKLWVSLYFYYLRKIIKSLHFASQRWSSYKWQAKNELPFWNASTPKSRNSTKLYLYIILSKIGSLWIQFLIRDYLIQATCHNSILKSTYLGLPL